MSYPDIDDTDYPDGTNEADRPDPICDCGAILTTDDTDDDEGLICNACYQLAMHEQWKEECEIMRSWR